MSSLGRAHSRTEGGLYRYLEKFEHQSSLRDLLDRMAASRAVRNTSAADPLNGAAPGAEYVFMQTDFASDGLHPCVAIINDDV